MNSVNSHKVGLVLGGVLAIWHAIWALMVLFGVAKLFLDWIFGLHFLNFTYSINPFAIGKAILLIIVTGIIGYIFGFIIGWLWNMTHRASHSR